MSEKKPKTVLEQGQAFGDQSLQNNLIVGRADVAAKTPQNRIIDITDQFVGKSIILTGTNKNLTVLGCGIESCGRIVC